MMPRVTRLAPISLVVLLMGATTEYRVDWTALERAVTQYVQGHDRSAAGEIERLLPAGSVDRHVGVFNVAASGRIFQQLDALDRLVKHGEPEAVDVAFALTAMSDGHFTETLLSMIASSLDVDPIIFLGALRKNRARVFASCELAYDTGLDYVDDPKAELKVLERRLEAVQRVQRSDFD